MLAMERLPPSQPFSTALPLQSPLQSPRSAGLPPPLCMHGSSVMHPTAALHVSLPGPYSNMKPQSGSVTLTHPQSSSSLSSLHTPPPYDHPGLPLSLSLQGSVFSSTGIAHAAMGPGLSALSPEHEHPHHHRHAGADSPRLVPPTSITIPHLSTMTAAHASSSTSSTSTEGSTGSPPGILIR